MKLLRRDIATSMQRAHDLHAVGLVVTKGPLRGRAQVWIDGELDATIDTRRSKNQFRVLAYTGRWATSGRHTLRVVVVGTPHRPRVDVDAFVIVP